MAVPQCKATTPLQLWNLIVTPQCFLRLWLCTLFIQPLTDATFEVNTGANSLVHVFNESIRGPGGAKGKTSSASHDLSVFLYVSGGVNILLVVVFAFMHKPQQTSVPESHDSDDEPGNVADPTSVAIEGSSEVLAADGSPDALAAELSKIRKKKNKLVTQRALNQRKLKATLTSLIQKEEALATQLEAARQGGAQAAAQSAQPEEETAENRRAKEVAATKIQAIQRGIATRIKVIKATAQASDMMQASDIISNPSGHLLQSAAPMVQLTHKTIMQRLDTKPEVEFKEKAKVLRKKMMNEFTKDLEDALQVNETSKVAEEAMTHKTEIPPASVVLSTWAAKPSIMSMHVQHLMAVGQNLLFCLMSIAVVASNAQHPCHEGSAMQGAMHAWLIADGIVNLLCAFFAVKAVQATGSLLSQLSIPPTLDLQSEPVKALEKFVDYATTTGADALLELERLRETNVHHRCMVGTAFQMVWFVYAVHLAFNTSWYDCEGRALYGLVVLRIRVVLYFVLLVPMLISTVLYFVDLVASAVLHKVLIVVAFTIDQSLDLGFPMLTMLIRAFFVQDKQEVLKIKEKSVARHAAETEDDLAYLKAKLQEIEEEKERTRLQIVEIRQEQERENAEDEGVQSEVLKAQKDKILNSFQGMMSRIDAKSRRSGEEAGVEPDQIRDWQEQQAREAIQRVRSVPKQVVGRLRNYTFGDEASAASASSSVAGVMTSVQAAPLELPSQLPSASTAAADYEAAPSTAVAGTEEGAGAAVDDIGADGSGGGLGLTGPKRRSP